MSEMYRREVDTGKSGAVVPWNPDDSDAAAQALADVQGVPVNLPSEAKENAAVDFSEIGPPREQANIARQVRNRYAEIVSSK